MANANEPVKPQPQPLPINPKIAQLILDYNATLVVHPLLMSGNADYLSVKKSDFDLIRKNQYQLCKIVEMLMPLNIEGVTEVLRLVAVGLPDGEPRVRTFREYEQMRKLTLLTK